MEHDLEFPGHDAHRLREGATAMTVEGSPACVAPLAELRLGADRLGVAATAELPREVLDILRLRGVTGGPVLLIAEGRLRSVKDEAAPQFQLTRGAINEAPALASRGGFSAVVLILDGSRAGEREPTLAAIAPQLEPSSSLVVLAWPAPRSRRGHAAGNRGSGHLSL